jgi:protochlorophyllide reductase
MQQVAEEENFDMSNFTPLECDLGSFKSVRDFSKNLNEFRTGKPIDRLVFNAAVYQPTLDYAKYTEDDIEQQFQINYLSHFLMCSILVSKLFFLLSLRFNSTINAYIFRCQR